MDVHYNRQSRFELVGKLFMQSLLLHHRAARIFSSAPSNPYLIAVPGEGREGGGEGAQDKHV